MYLLTHNKIEHGDYSAAVQRMMVALGDQAGPVVEELKKDPEYVARVAQFMKYGGYMPSAEHLKARKIMGANVYGVEEAVRYIGAVPRTVDLKALEHIPFTEALLRKCKHTHVLMARFGFPINFMRELIGQELFFFSNKEDDKRIWYRCCRFFYNPVPAKWCLIRQELIDGSLGRSMDELKGSLIPTGEYLPLARDIVWLLMLHFRMTGNLLWEDVNILTADTVSAADESKSIPNTNIIVEILFTKKLSFNYLQPSDSTEGCGLLTSCSANC